MDEEVLLLAGIRGQQDTESQPENSNQSTRVIIKPAWLRTSSETASSVDNPSPGPSESTSASKKTASAQKLKKRKISSTSTPRNLRQRAKSRLSPEAVDIMNDSDSADNEVRMSGSSGNDNLLAGFKEYMSGQLSDLKSDFKRDMNDAVKKVADQVNTNTENISMIRKDLNENLSRNVATAVDKEMRKYGLQRGKQPCGTNTENDNYWRCRRSIRCWPVQGPDAELWGLTGDFMIKILGIPPNCLPQDTVESIRRISTPRARRPGKIHNEVLITFKEVATRDMVYSYAPNLAKYRQEKSPPGVRIDFPDHLRGIFSTLEKYGATMRSELGPGLKRSIKFDDTEMSLRIDVCFPGDDDWTKVSYELAREEVEKRKKTESEATRNRLGSLSENSSCGSWKETSASSQRTNAMIHALSDTPLPESSTLSKSSTSDRPPPRWGQRK